VRRGWPEVLSLLALLVGSQFTCFTRECLSFDVVGWRDVAETDSRERYDREVDAHCARRRRVSICTFVVVTSKARKLRAA
jgi:hypothetical protein